MISSKIFIEIESKDVGLYFLDTFFVLSCEQVQCYFFFHSEGGSSSFKQSLKLVDSDLVTEFLHTLIIRILMIS